MQAWVWWLFVVTAVLVGIPDLVPRLPLAAAWAPAPRMPTRRRERAWAADMLALGVLAIALFRGAHKPQPRPKPPNPDEPIPYRLTPKATPVPYWPASPPEMAGAA